jgi:hypothetical protein
MWGFGKEYVIKVLEMGTEDTAIIITTTIMVTIIMEVILFLFEGSIGGVPQVELIKPSVGTTMLITIMDGALTITINFLEIASIKCMQDMILIFLGSWRGTSSIMPIEIFA